jgi:hypothetical protein
MPATFDEASEARTPAHEMLDARKRAHVTPEARHLMHATPRRVLDVVLGCVLIVQMATGAVEDAPHEWVGMAALALTIAHLVANRKLTAALARRRRASDVALLVMDALLLACLVCLAASSVVLSRYALWWLPSVPGASWARPMHLVCSQLCLLLAAVHVGIHLRRLPARVRSSSLMYRHPAVIWPIRAALVAAALLGCWSFVQLRIGSYLTLAARFAASRSSIPLALRFIEYASVGFLFALVACLITGALTQSHGARTRSAR